MGGQTMSERIFVFRETERRMKRNDRERPLMFAIPESQIVSIQSQFGSQNCYLEVNGIDVVGSFDDFVKQLGERVDIK
jgi:hypothetical protein